MMDEWGGDCLLKRMYLNVVGRYRSKMYSIITHYLSLSHIHRRISRYRSMRH
jgi:hypothetical protein